MTGYRGLEMWNVTKGLGRGLNLKCPLPKGSHFQSWVLSFWYYDLKVYATEGSETW